MANRIVNIVPKRPLFPTDQQLLDYFFYYIPAKDADDAGDIDMMKEAAREYLDSFKGQISSKVTVKRLVDHYYLHN